MLNQHNYTARDKELIAIGNSHPNVESFKAWDLPNYLLCKRKMFINKLFPTHTCALPPNFLDPSILTAKVKHYRGAIAMARIQLDTVDTKDFLTDKQFEASITKLRTRLKDLLW